jgi:hypothetical protein
MLNADWSTLTDEQQLASARGALRGAADTLADHAEVLAEEMDYGTLREVLLQSLKQPVNGLSRD